MNVAGEVCFAPMRMMRFSFWHEILPLNSENRSSSCQHIETMPIRSDSGILVAVQRRCVRLHEIASISSDSRSIFSKHPRKIISSRVQITRHTMLGSKKMRMHMAGHRVIHMDQRSMDMKSSRGTGTMSGSSSRHVSMSMTGILHSTYSLCVFSRNFGVFLFLRQISLLAHKFPPCIQNSRLHSAMSITLPYEKKYRYSEASVYKKKYS